MSVILVVHRYLGVAVGLLMTLWCLSGFVMMYQQMPEVTDAERLQGLAPLAADGGWALDAVPVPDDAQVSAFRVEMMGDRAVLRLSSDGQRIYDLRSGRAIGVIAEEDARAVADSYRRGHGLSAEPSRVATVALDQWTLQSRRHAPMWRFDYADGRGSSVYVSSRTGEVVQETTTLTRTLAWLGVIPHWLYPTFLRQNGPLWSQIVIWASVLGVFLTATGLYVGISRLRGRTGRWFPYKRVWLWHHVAGVFFGVLTLTWVFSGLLTMDPWGVLVSDPSVGQAEVVGTTSWRQTRAMLAQAPRLATGDVREIREATLAGRPHMLVLGADGAAQRLGADGAPAPLGQDELASALHARGGLLADAAVTLQEREDSYYYGENASFPVFRVDLTDAASTTLYMDPETGDVVGLADATSRQSRWLETGLHSLDFPVLRRRPLWDIVVIVLLAGVTAVCATGTWLAIQRVRRDVTPGARFSRNPRQTAAE